MIDLAFHENMTLEYFSWSLRPAANISMLSEHKHIVFIKVGQMEIKQKSFPAVVAPCSSSSSWVTGSQMYLQTCIYTGPVIGSPRITFVDTRSEQGLHQHGVSCSSFYL